LIRDWQNAQDEQTRPNSGISEDSARSNRGVKEELTQDINALQRRTVVEPNHIRRVVVGKIIFTRACGKRWRSNGHLPLDERYLYRLRRRRPESLSPWLAWIQKLNLLRTPYPMTGAGVDCCGAHPRGGSLFTLSCRGSHRRHVGAIDLLVIKYCYWTK
jgi:hypothetical protein